MQYRLGVEDIEPNHWVAWALDLPGCFSSAQTQEEVVAQAPARISAYFAWLSLHGRGAPLAHEPIEIQVAQVLRAFPSEDDYLVNAFFEDDRRPLTDTEVEEGLRLLDCTRRDLLVVIQSVPSEKLRQPIPGEVQASVEGILNHVAWAEWWYFDRLGLAFDNQEMPADFMAKLVTVRVQTQAQLPKLVGDDQIVERLGELWSARKVLRRALWHERDHTHHITRLLAA